MNQLIKRMKFILYLLKYYISKDKKHALYVLLEFLKSEPHIDYENYTRDLYEYFVRHLLVYAKYLSKEHNKEFHGITFSANISTDNNTKQYNVFVDMDFNEIIQSENEVVNEREN